MLLSGLGLCADPGRPATAAVVRRQIERMGYVQVDTISVVARAHDHVLFSRFAGYRPDHLRTLLERRRQLFEHWTHDASVIPSAWLAFWKQRFNRHRRRRQDFDRWLSARMGDRPEKLLRAVTRRIEREGAMRSRDFEVPEGRRGGAWWGWAPHKAALEYLWRTGRLSISRRDNFDKVYDLTERVFPHVQELPTPSRRAYVDWACTTALDRLGAAAPRELADFLGDVNVDEARTWCGTAVRGGRALAVRMESVRGDAPVDGVAVPTWRRRVARATAPDVLRPLSPFDPVVRDRRRALRVFGFDYRFEAFVPAPRRKYGYYVLPLLDVDRMVGRLDADPTPARRGPRAVHGAAAGYGGAARIGGAAPAAGPGGRVDGRASRRRSARPKRGVRARRSRRYHRSRDRHVSRADHAGMVRETDGAHRPPRAVLDRRAPAPRAQAHPERGGPDVGALVRERRSAGVAALSQRVLGPADRSGRRHDHDLRHRRDDGAALAAGLGPAVHRRLDRRIPGHRGHHRAAP
jgi:uncharacterized protein YcaQ